jgi:hypothetical protein
MFIVEQEIVPPKTSIEFQVLLPEDAFIQSTYQRDGKFFVLYKCHKAVGNDGLIQRRFHVFWLRNNESIGVTVFSAGNVRYVGGDHFASQPGGAEATVHFFEILEEEKTS